jgi:hypothetical protein
MTRDEVINDYQGYRSQFWRDTISNVTAALTVDKTPVFGMIAWYI